MVFTHGLDGEIGNAYRLTVGKLRDVWDCEYLGDKWMMLTRGYGI
jgi:hypothetical protein